MINAFHGISHKASTKILGFGLQELNNFFSMPSICCYLKKSITSLVHQIVQTHITTIQFKDKTQKTHLPTQKIPKPQKTCKLWHFEKTEAFVSFTCMSHLFLAQCTCKLKCCNTFLSKGLNSLRGKKPLSFWIPFNPFLVLNTSLKATQSRIISVGPKWRQYIDFYFLSFTPSLAEGGQKGKTWF